ncbi:opacity protein-like surface antigen [Sphingomonas sp. F9_3S_D5_B_2]
MRRFLLATVAALVIATPAAARDGSPYIGIEGGLLFPRSTKVDLYGNDGTTSGTFNNGFSIKYKNGYDVDAIAGYDLGMFRIEGELGYKRAKLDRVSNVDPAVLDAIENTTGTPVTAADLDFGGGHASVLSGMLNGLVDFSVGNSLGVYAGGGVGRARVKYSLDGGSDSDNAWAWQLIAGVHAPVSDNIDVGLKYRYFQTGRLNFSDSADVGATTYDAALRGKFRSHSVLASLAYNFGGVAAALPPPPPPPPPPPAPEAPATQTCPDGSVILATSACPAPPPPPPPPPATTGERGR